ncbi:Scr1 family TA system antitoxin-like transcriptional regulator [Streptomyces sp. NRRL S-495]|uniref:Scr1 family TA system antitoxin-like transcriptional regulator n=1 Tax=Streptomyces sp. NRRL S-495 TaxID=1609133 RepID=UPI00257053B7|nr:Scr1 family TA system antitoxin-like transcriptional regulator [Streptomyces sp. NRRL S-495]
MPTSTSAQTTEVRRIRRWNPAPSGLDGPFVLMGFPDPNPEVVWMENGPNSVYFEGADEVDHYTEVFDHLRARTLGPLETHARLTSLLKEKRT